MTQAELIESMRHGAHNPREKRSEDDLGRFGLGLKTASFSQCSKLTVVSAREKVLSGVMWDLELVAIRDDWIICMLDEQEIKMLSFIDRLPERGTMVLWENLDRLCEGLTEDVNEKLINEKIKDLEKHLSLVFHRYMSGEIKGRKFDIAINFHTIEPFDPFCKSNKATQLLQREIIRIDGAEVSIQPYILPYHSKLSARERDFYNNRSDFLNNQGSYVYRNGRLMAWGDWFRLVPKGEATKLARVCIDFPNSIDEYWTIDIKKSRAYPPFPVRTQIKKIIGRITEGSTKVIRNKGKKLYSSISKPVWLRIAGRNFVEYKLDRNHPVICAFMASLEEKKKKHIHAVFSLIESSMPIETIYADYTLSPEEIGNRKDIETEEILERLENIWDILSDSPEKGLQPFMDVVKSVKPFSDYPAIVDRFIGRKTDAQTGF
jgi:hypothetical protein